MLESHARHCNQIEQILMPENYCSEAPGLGMRQLMLAAQTAAALHAFNKINGSVMKLA